MCDELDREASVDREDGEAEGVEYVQADPSPCFQCHVCLYSVQLIVHHAIPDSFYCNLEF